MIEQELNHYPFTLLSEASRHRLNQGMDLAYFEKGDIILDAASPLAIDAPYRAHDAATVPLVLTQTNPEVAITSATVVIDENPAPVAAELTFSEAMAPIDFELRVRVDL